MMELKSFSPIELSRSIRKLLTVSWKTVSNFTKIGKSSQSFNLGAISDI